MNRLIPAAVSLGLALPLPAMATDLTEMTDGERAAFRQEVRAYLLDNPEVIMEAVDQLRQQEEAAAADQDVTLVQTNAQAIYDDGFSWVGGNPEGDVTVVEFLDYRCGYCRKAYDEVNELVQSDGNIRFVVKELPILGEASLTSSRFAIAVKQLEGDAAYEGVHDALMTYKGEVTEPALRRLAGTYGLDADAVLDHMQSDEVAEEIAQTRALAQRLQISGTPTFVMGDQMLRGYAPLDVMREIVANERADG
ncbi:thioredoxin domain-containing protein [Aquicoccus sp. SCR17]|nr:thioredoxin domain-containing protein [Carideicomes alvinocaridis]